MRSRASLVSLPVAFVKARASLVHLPVAFVKARASLVHLPVAFVKARASLVHLPVAPVNPEAKPMHLPAWLARLPRVYVFRAAMTTCGYGKMSGTRTMRTLKPRPVSISAHSRWCR
jgi:hypothetical protein